VTGRLLVFGARPILLLAVFATAALAPAARSQDATTQERLDRLERDLSMLQRQVYRDGVSPGEDANPGGSSNLAVDTQIRMQRLEEEMRDLTGKVQDEANEVQQLRQRIEQINSDIDVRFGELGQAGSQARTSEPPPGRRSQRQAFAGSGTADLPDNGPPRGSPDAGMPPPPPPYGGAAPPALPALDAAGTLTPPTDAPPPRFAPQAASAAAGGGLRPPEPTLPAASASAQYNSAFGLLRRADYQDAEDAFRNFVRQHPDSGLAGNAQYWLGESYYARGRYSDAAVAFAEGYKRYPRGPKASETLLSLATALGRAQQKQNACVALAQLDHAFPHAASTIKERAAAEKKRFGC
jgi:tol-pal system protein YbgF